MKTVSKRILALMLSTLLMLTLVACGGTGDKQGKESAEKTLYVAAINKGYGIEWLDAMLKTFCEEIGWKYELYPVYADTEMSQKIEAGKVACNYDLVFAGSTMIADSKYLLDLSDVLASTIEGGDRSGKKISEVIDPTVYASLEDRNEEGKYYRMPWTGGVNGLLVNNEAITKTMGADWKEQYPCRTTEELLDFCAALQAKGLVPFIHSAETHYYNFLYEAWFAQYNGTDGMSDYFNGVFTDYLGEETVGAGVARNAGTLESAKVMESIFSKGYSHQKSNSIDWEVTQTMFMSGQAAMFSNGDWNHVEMMKQFPNSDIQFMKLPMISALGTKLGITDEQLAQVVDYVDGKGENPGVSSSSYTAEEIVKTISDARSWVASYADMHNVFIVEYSEHVETAKEFLKFMVSDEGQHIFSETTGGLTMCYGYDLEKDSNYSALSDFAKTRWEVAKNANLYITNRGEAFARAGLGPFKVRGSAPLEVLLSRADERYTAQMIYDYDYTHFQNNWNMFVSSIK